MPYISQWVAPEIFMRYKGIDVFRVYKDNDMEQGVLEYWYTTEKDSDEGDFDVRDLQVPSTAILRAPPIPFVNSPAYLKASEDEQTRICEQWKQWNAVSMECVIRNSLREAIDAGVGPFAGMETKPDDDADGGAESPADDIGEDEITEHLSQRIENGDLDLEDIPRRMARYGLMDPAEFLAEMRERMAIG